MDIFARIEEMVGRDEPLSQADALALLDGSRCDLLPLLQVAYFWRRKYFSDTVTLHVLNNVQNGLCAEDCRYCAQSSAASAQIETYPMKPDAEILAEAAAAYRNGAGRYCMVFSGTGPSDDRVRHLSGLIREIKRRHKIEVCVSPGVINEAQARTLKDAGLDRLNHNLNTSEKYYGHICTSHSYGDRLATLAAAHSAGLDICSGVIIGMGEGPEDVYAMARRFSGLAVRSIPVNFFIPIPGVMLKEAKGLTPEYCLRVLCLFRLMNPRCEIRMAAGRELHLGSLQPMGLFPANSLFLQGYLNARGSSDISTLRMIRDMGFSIKSDIPLESLLDERDRLANEGQIKDKGDLRPFQGRT